MAKETKLYEIEKPAERVILIAVDEDGGADDDLLNELEELSATAGAVTVGRVIQKREKRHPGHYIGKGKVEEVKMMITALDATGIITDDELTPAQMRNLEDMLGTKVMDRTMVILDIFASRALSNEGKIQVELAQLKYSLTRLSGQGTALSRLGGGIGTRGPGEKKLETDRRYIKERIAELEKSLKDIGTHRELLRNGRDRKSIINVSLVGYTNAGKSTLLNIIAGLDTPTSGAVYIDGKKIEGTGTERGVVFQQYALFPWLTVLKNVMFGLKLQGKSDAEAKEIAMKYIKMVQLEDFVNHYPKELSGGMKQRVAIARAYAVKPEVLLMDEPFGALDAQTRTQLQTELLKTWESERKTCFFITHDVDEAIILAQRVIVMSARPGRIKDIVDIDIPYPRDQETKMSPRFMELKNHIWSQVYQEYLEVRK